MKKLFTIASLMAFVLVSCDTDEAKGEEKGEGRVTIECGVSTDVQVTRANVTCTTPEESAFNLAIEGTDYSNSWESIADFGENNYLKYGEYTATVTAGDIAEEGYDKATFVGSANFTVEARKESNVQITATIANALVKVVVTDAFKTYFPGGYSLKLTTEAGSEFDVTAQTDYLFIAPTSFVVTGAATKQANQSGEAAVEVTLPEYKCETLAAQTCYVVKIDVSNAGQAELKISLNDDLVESTPIEQELNDNSENAL